MTSFRFLRMYRDSINPKSNSIDFLPFSVLIKEQICNKRTIIIQEKTITLIRKRTKKKQNNHDFLPSLADRSRVELALLPRLSLTRFSRTQSLFLLQRIICNKRNQNPPRYVNTIKIPPKIQCLKIKIRKPLTAKIKITIKIKKQKTTSNWVNRK
ncbi:hypothetical protein V6Z11_D03G156000 [Gossypium hirsutum]